MAEGDRAGATFSGLDREVGRSLPLGEPRPPVEAGPRQEEAGGEDRDDERAGTGGSQGAPRPLRAVVPSRRGWHWVKWLTEINVLSNV